MVYRRRLTSPMPWGEGIDVESNIFEMGGPQLEDVLGVGRGERDLAGVLGPGPMGSQPAPAAVGRAPEPTKSYSSQQWTKWNFDLAKEEALRMLNEDAPKRPPMKLQWNEILAASLNPKLLPFIFEQKAAPYFDEIERRKDKMASLKTMLGILEPEKPAEYTLGEGEVRYRGGEPIAAGMPRQQKAGDRFEPIGAGGSIDVETGQIISPATTQTDRPVPVGKYGVYLPPGTKRGTIIGGEPAGGAPGSAIVPERLWGTYLRNRVNPVPPGHPHYDSMERLLESMGGRLDERIQNEAREAYRRVYEQTMEGLTFGGVANAEDVEAAENAAAEAFQGYVQRFLPQRPPRRPTIPGPGTAAAGGGPRATGPLAPSELGLIPPEATRPMPIDRPRMPMARPQGAQIAGAPQPGRPGLFAPPYMPGPGRPQLEAFLAQQIAAGKTKEQAFEAARQAGY